ncbi:sodium/sugar symporter [Marinimicrobium sp. ABcell2]|uniref:sodium/sugar symporter n=1 Tax=Marinimicrobium sp. ABcell2 TaxID=3069751 RepID=UPI0027B7199B|nr:sodium/sugar symporter [Marinimicrobium sp. ABcell2]MDQ2077102.1 sodium/sugar symporter [Marinimicrobium sp. ABcell2]
MRLSSLDIATFIVYCLALIGIAWWVSREKAGHVKNTQDYFLASKSLPWWAIGASLIAANISAEQIIGMSGDGFRMGMAIASYEWMAALTLLIVGKFFLPIFLKKGIYTMPQFLEERFDYRVRIVMAIFWLGVYTFVNLAAVLWLGALAINTITGVDVAYGMVFLALFSIGYSIYGGLKAIALTDIIQVVLLICGGLMVSYLALNNISDSFGDGGGAWQGFSIMLAEVPEKFNMIFDPDHEHYISLPGLSVLIGGMWIMNLSYWGFNQYITQRALAAKSLKEAQKGIAFAAYLKLLMPVIVVLPGIAAYMLRPDLEMADQAYPTMMQLVPQGLLGITFAALVAAIASSLGSMTNSISTIFTVDIYKKLINPEASEKRSVLVGRSAAIVAMLCAVIVARPLLGNLPGAFQYIQEFTGFFTPGIVAIFLLGFFWKKATALSALVAAIGSAVLSLAFYLWWPALPFIDRVGLVFITCMVLAVVITLASGAKEHDKAIELDDIQFSTTTSFNLASLGVVLILIALYAAWW